MPELGRCAGADLTIHPTQTTQTIQAIQAIASVDALSLTLLCLFVHNSWHGHRLLDVATFAVLSLFDRQQLGFKD